MPLFEDDEPPWCMYAFYAALWELPYLNADGTPHESNAWPPERRKEFAIQRLERDMAPCRKCPGCAINGDAS